MDCYQLFSLGVNFFVAFGTILLAYYAYKNIKVTQNQLKSFQEQTKMTQEQTKMLISQNQPILRFESFSFAGDILNIGIKNIGNQPAFDIGFSTICLPVKKVADIKDMEWLLNFEWPHVTKDQVKDFFDLSPDQQLIISDYDNENVLSGKKDYKFKPETGFTYLKRDNGEAVLPHSETIQIFHSEPFFCLDNDFQNFKKIFLKGNPEALRGYQHRRYKFNEIADIYRQNKVEYVYLAFSLYCKDLIENEVYQNDIATCIVDLNKDKTIEDAIMKPRKLVRYPISHLTLVKEIGFEPMWMYTNGKWKKPLLTEIEKEKSSQPHAQIHIPPK